jgi:hypothetical protein
MDRLDVGRSRDGLDQSFVVGLMRNADAAATAMGPETNGSDALKPFRDGGHVRSYLNEASSNPWKLMAVAELAAQNGNQNDDAINQRNLTCDSRIVRKLEAVMARS